MHRKKFIFNKTNRRTNFPNLFLSRNSICFGQFLCPSLVFHYTFGTGTCHAGFMTAFKHFQARPGRAGKLAWHIPVPNVQWKTPDDGQRNCPKPLEFPDKNKFGKLVRLLVLLKRILNYDCMLTYHVRSRIWGLYQCFPSRVLQNSVRGSERNNSLFKYKFWYAAKFPKHTSIYQGIFVRKFTIVE